MLSADEVGEGGGGGDGVERVGRDVLFIERYLVRTKEVAVVQEKQRPSEKDRRVDSAPFNAILVRNKGYTGMLVLLSLQQPLPLSVVLERPAPGFSLPYYCPS